MFADGARDSTEDMLGRLVDNRYKILEAMASGSMGAVFKAERVPVGKLVAIKFLHSSFAGDAEFLTRFERETRVMSKLAHPNCVSVVDFGVWESAPYLVMEYVAGKTLRQILDAGPIQPMRALALTKQIAAGLAHAHAQGITHRDVKPANIMITEEIGTGEHVRILDFGLARLRGAVGRDATQTNVVVGTPNYMAPEQTVGGSTIDARTDVYAVGVVLFEMICGQRPFQAEDTLALLGMHRAAPIPKVADRVDHTVVLPAGLQDLVDTAMAKSPEDRFQSAVELANAIDEMTTVQRTPPPGSITISPSMRKSASVNSPTIVDIKHDRSEKVKRPASRFPVLLVLLVLAGGAAAAWYLQNRKKEVTDTHADEPKGSGTAVAIGTPVDAAPAVGVTPDAAQAMVMVDASTVTVLDPEPDAGELVIQNPIDLNEAEPVPSPEAAENPAPQDPNKPEIDDEADDAPKSDQEVEVHVEKKVAADKPQLATTIRGAVQLIQQNKDDLALASLRQIWKKTPKSAYVPFLLGNLYFDKRWWSVAMDHYKIAIAKNAGYKKNATLIRNIIRTLGSVKTNKRAQVFLRNLIGKPAIPYLKYAAQHEKNPHIKKWAAYMAKAIR
ncbi:MAG: protein kinase [Myxococcota bacterium]|nr:protein kinase [Myxococcota bacterium]